MRARINKIDESTQTQRIINALSQIYEIPYSTVRTYYYRYGEKTNTTKLHLSRIYRIGNELSTIN